jgi:hypothetical protein
VQLNNKIHSQRKREVIPLMDLFLPSRLCPYVTDPHGITDISEEQEELDSLNNAFSVVGEFCLTALSGVEDSEKREITQAWNVLQQHFLSYEWHLREKGDRDRRRMGLAGLVQSTQAQLENIKGLMTLL